MQLARRRDLHAWDSLVRGYGDVGIRPTSSVMMSSQPTGCPREVDECFGVNVVCPALLAPDEAALEKEGYVGFP